LTEPAAQQSGADRDPTRAPLGWLLAAIVLAGAAFRFYGLDVQSLWNDELASWLQSAYPTLGEVIRLGVAPDTHPPGYQVGLWFVERWIGDSETALRLPSAVAGVGAILAMYWLGARLYTRREGIIAAAITAFSYQPIYYSQEARAYVFLFLFAILSGGFWFRLLPRSDGAPPSRLDQTGFVLTAIATSYLHYFGLLLVALEVAGLCLLCVRDRRALLRAIALSSLVAAAYLPWLPYLLEEFEVTAFHPPEPTLDTALYYWRWIFYNPGDHLKWFAAALFGIAIARSAAERESRPLCTRTTLLLVAWLVLPFAIAFVRSKLSVPMMTHRNLIISLPPALLLFSRAITRTVPDARLQAVTVGAIVAIHVYGMLVSGGYYRHPRKEQFREAAAVVSQREGEFAGARVVAHAWSAAIFDYYLERTGAASRVDLLAGTAEDVERLNRFLDAEDPDHVWFLLGHRQPEPPFMDALDARLELVFHVPLKGAFARLYRQRDGS